MTIEYDEKMMQYLEDRLRAIKQYRQMLDSQIDLLEKQKTALRALDWEQAKQEVEVIGSLDAGRKALATPMHLKK